MRHRIKFVYNGVEKDTWTDWGLLPTKQPVIAPPPFRKNSIKLPGRSGEIDLSETITGYPLYDNRTGQLSFIKVDRWQDYQTIKNEMLEFLHGQQIQMILTDDPSWYYEGRISVNKLACDELHGTIAVKYNLEPYKWALDGTLEPWKWDTFSFVDGVIYNGVYIDETQTPSIVYSSAGLFTNLSVGHTAVALDFPAQATGSAPLSVLFYAVSQKVSITAMQGSTQLGEELVVNSGNYAAMPGLVLWRGKWLYSGKECNVYAIEKEAGAASNTGLMLSFRAGRL